MERSRVGNDRKNMPVNITTLKMCLLLEISHLNKSGYLLKRCIHHVAALFNGKSHANKDACRDIIITITILPIHDVRTSRKKMFVSRATFSADSRCTVWR